MDKLKIFLYLLLLLLLLLLLFYVYFLAPITSAKLSNDQNCVLVSTMDSTIRLMDKSSGKLLNQFKGHQQEKYKIDSVFSYNDAYVISGSEDGFIYIWDNLEGNVIKNVKSHSGTISTVDHHPSTFSYITGGDDGIIRVWE